MWCSKESAGLIHTHLSEQCWGSHLLQSQQFSMQLQGSSDDDQSAKIYWWVHIGKCEFISDILYQILVGFKWHLRCVKRGGDQHHRTLKSPSGPVFPYPTVWLEVCLGQASCWSTQATNTLSWWAVACDNWHQPDCKTQWELADGQEASIARTTAKKGRPSKQRFHCHHSLLQSRIPACFKAKSEDFLSQCNSETVGESGWKLRKLAKCLFFMGVFINCVHRDVIL